jgi:alpha-1,6-mannosyltransferase
MKPTARPNVEVESGQRLIVPQTNSFSSIAVAWLALGTLLAAFAGVLVASSAYFGADVELIDMPAIPLAAGLVLAGAAFLLVLPLIRRSIAAGFGADRHLLWIVLAFGLVFRLLLLGSTPAFEDDWNRYLWDGAVTANGYNPYAVSPDDAQTEPYHYTLQKLAHESGTVIERVNHSHLKTIYPPVAQGAFALAYALKPWSLTAWRLVLLACEMGTLALLLLLLRDAGRSELWAALYWWNPIAVKELINSAHMEGIVTPLVLGAIWLSLKKWPLAATAGLGLAIGAKLWPAMLAPLILRPLLGEPRRLALAVAVLLTLVALWAWPILIGGVDQTSGFVAFAQQWRTNSAHFPFLANLASKVLAPLGLAETTPGVIVRGMLAAGIGCFALWVCRRPIDGAQDLMQRAGLITAALYLVSPAQFPWYAIWMMPFLCFRPWLGLMAITALVPIYYAAFYFIARDTHEIFRTYIVWLIWVPVWSLLAHEYWRSRSNDHPATSTAERQHA